MQFIAFADPLFSRPADSEEQTSLSGRGTGLFERGRLTPLPHSRDEAETIAAMFPEGSSVVLVGEKATEEALKRDSLQKYRFVHFATHALIDDQFPYRSCVVLSQDQDPDDDGFLQLNEVFNLELNADLVALSACKSALGKRVDGEGIVGLSRGFFYAGARSLLLSLWEIEDRSTADLMVSFYQGISRGSPVRESLRSAKLRMLSSPNPALHHPYYWAPFVLHGAESGPKDLGR